MSLWLIAAAAKIEAAWDCNMHFRIAAARGIEKAEHLKNGTWRLRCKTTGLRVS